MAERLMDRVKARRDSEGGFTLIELLVVIIILGILAAVVVFSVSGINDTGGRAACAIDARTLRTAAEAHFAEYGAYTNTAGTDDPAPPDWTTPATTSAANGNQIQESQLSSNGFLSDDSASESHNLFLVDLNSGVGVTTGVRVVVEDIAGPGADCGAAVGAVTGTCGPAIPPALLTQPNANGDCATGVEKNV